MTIEEIIKEYLKEKGFDGLRGDHCGCELADLMPCEGLGLEEPIGLCEPGYKVPCDCGDGCNFHIVKTKPKEYRQAVGAAPGFLGGEKPEDVIRMAREET